jgi:hypothetical protein
MNKSYLYLLALGAAAIALFTASSSQAQTESGGSVPGPLQNSKTGILSAAIGMAEGFGQPGAIPTRANNPGDLAVGDKGLGTLGAEKITVFASLDDGWNALNHIIDGWLSGRSAIYFLTDTFREVGRKYVNGPAASESEQSLYWATNVANELGVGIDMTLQEWVNS